MNDQRRIQAIRPAHERLYIGGEIEVHHLTKDGFAFYTLYRFEDYDRDEKGYLSKLQAKGLVDAALGAILLGSRNVR